MNAAGGHAVRDGQLDTVACTCCPRACTLREGQLGRCRARRAEDGAVVCESFGRVTGIALDPIEKKPLAHFMPGAAVLSVGSYGCNMGCPFCQNAEIAAAGPNDVTWETWTPEELVALAERLKPQGNVGIAYTYNEPLVGWEFVRGCAQLAHEAGLVNVLVSNGMASTWVVEELLPLLDAANIDLKGPSQEYYDFVGGDFAAVGATIAALATCPTCHLEVTTLVVPGRNDAPEDIERIATWLSSLDPGIPYHVSRFFPRHRMSDAAPTPVETVYRLADVARQHLRAVHTGNC